MGNEHLAKPQIIYSFFRSGWVVLLNIPGDESDSFLCVGGRIRGRNGQDIPIGQPDSYYFMTREDAERTLGNFKRKYIKEPEWVTNI